MPGVLLLFLLPLLAADPGLAEAEAKAAQALAAGNKLEALGFFEEALRIAPDTATKARLRDQYLKVGWAPPPPPNPAEQLTLARHIAEEKIRVFTLAADKLEDADRLHASILVRRAVIELLGADEGRVKAQEDRILTLLRKLTQEPRDEDKELVTQLLASKKEGKSLLRAGEKLLEEGKYRAVVRLCQELVYSTFEQEVKDAATELRARTEQRAVEAVSAAERLEAKDVLLDDRFDRLDLSLSRHFLHLGPKVFVNAIPEQQRMLLDLAYIHQSDLAAQPLTADGVRIVIYYQETFDFGGGLAGGKLIRIGNRAIRLPIAGMLHYHELGHCIFGKGWLHHGFTEGLADFAAGFTLDALGQTAEARRFITDARDQFVRFYLGRAVRYFDIQPYRPSAGFLFSFLPPGDAPYDWTPYRTAFRQMRDAQFGGWPERQHQIMRYFGYLMARHYGAEVYERLAEWGWPVSPRDISLVPLEAERLLSETKQGLFQAWRGNHGAATHLLRGVLEAEPDGPLVPTALFGLLQVAVGTGDLAAAGRLRSRLGIVDAFQVLGPYHARQQTAYVVTPPETQILPGEPVLFGFETAHWKAAKVDETGYVDLRNQGYGYPEHACALALAYVLTEIETPARVWLGSDDGHTLLVNGHLIEKRDTSRGFTLDDDFADVTLRRGWNRILLKVHNGAGTWGFLMRLTAPDGKPLQGVTITGEDKEADVAPDPPHTAKGRGLLAEEWKGLSSSRWITGTGKWDAQNGLLRPLGTDKFGLWQRFVVDPDNPKDGPANILWFKSEELALLDSFELELTVQGGERLPAKFGLTIDGENENDGQSGHTLVLDENDSKLRCHWYRYDKLLYLQQGAPVPPAESYRLVLRRLGSKWWLLVNDVPLFDGVDAPRLPGLGLGLLTWGKAPLFDSMRLRLR